MKNNNFITINEKEKRLNKIKISLNYLFFLI